MGEKWPRRLGEVAALIGTATVAPLVLLAGRRVRREFVERHRRWAVSTLRRPIPEANPVSGRVWLACHAVFGGLAVLLLLVLWWTTYNVISMPYWYLKLPVGWLHFAIVIDSWPLALMFVPAGVVLTVVAWTVTLRVPHAAAVLVHRVLDPRSGNRITELTASRADAVDRQAAEVRRIERDLHDGAQVRLAALAINLGLAERLLEGDPRAAKALLVESRESTRVALDELRTLVRGIHPPVLSDRGLVGAVQALALDTPLSMDLELPAEIKLSLPAESAVYFAVAELLANALKHSEARRGWIRMWTDGPLLMVLVGDDGIGGAEPAAGGGLSGIDRRLSAFDGVMRVISPPGGPTEIRMEVPCE
ncbi:sensor histidine kinase [Pseudonocardiaceae bacterium YIM PH 21723]|nr:sensor histidine kinase [Pseudonocardiaceae bacterium YIM PH 21723]